MKKMIMMCAVLAVVGMVCSFMAYAEGDEDIFLKHDKWIEKIKSECLPDITIGNIGDKINTDESAYIRYYAPCVEKARQDLCARLGITPEDITETRDICLGGMQTNTWPVPSMMVLNWKVGFVYDGKAYVYGGRDTTTWGTTTTTVIWYVGVMDPAEFDESGRLKLEAYEGQRDETDDGELIARIGMPYDGPYLGPAPEDSMKVTDPKMSDASTLEKIKMLGSKLKALTSVPPGVQLVGEMAGENEPSVNRIARERGLGPDDKIWNLD